MTIYDEEDDMALISTVASELGGDILREEWDDFVTYNRDDLVRLDIMSDDGFVCQQGMTQLLIGVIRQMNGRMHRMEKELGYIH